MSRLFSTLVVLFLLLSPLPLHAAEPDRGLALRTAAALYEGIHTAELDNGLRIYLKPIPGSTSVTSMVVYKVGSADEDKNWTGLSHYLEHLMFKGTAKLKPGEIDRITFRAGGSNNAYTSNDLTAYHFTMPAGRWKDALEVEADRMRHLRIDKEHEFDKEKGAVINELAGNEDSPWDLEYKALLPRLFGAMHPYGHPVIGEAAHVKNATEKVIQEHYHRWYHPNNASLVLVGGFDLDEALRVIRKRFGPIPRAKLPARKEVPKSPTKLPVRYEMASKFTVSRMLMGFPTGKAGDEDQPALAVLEAILGQGKRCRLYRALVEGAEIASSIGVDHTPGRYAGYLLFSVELLPGKDRAQAEKLFLAELHKLREETVSKEELSRIQQQILASNVFRQESTYGLANSLGQAVTLTSLDFARQYLPRITAVTPEDVKRVARKYLETSRSATVWSIPPQKKLGLRSRTTPARSAARLAARQEERKELAFDLEKAQRVELPGGLVVLLFESRRLPLVEARIALRESSIYQRDHQLGVATLTGSLLEEGTTKRTGAEIAEAIENVGGVLSLGEGGGSVKVLSSDRKLALQLLLECFTQPAFPKDAFARVKAQLLAEIRENEVLPETRALQTFRKLVYGKHPLGRPSPGTIETVQELTPADCRTFHQNIFVPRNTILAIAGDFDSKQLLAEIKELVSGWKSRNLPPLERSEIALPAKSSQTILSMPQAAQLQVYMGHIGIRRDDPDFYKLLVMDYILGVGPGFTDRISARLRDREGLAYSVSASITGSAGLQQGMFNCYIGTDNDNLARVKKLFLEELQRIRAEKPSTQEVDDAKTYLIGSRLLQFATTGGIAGQLIALERFGLGLSYLRDFRKAVAAVTPEQVQEVARKHLHPDRMIMVAAGAVDKEGNPLPQKKE